MIGSDGIAGNLHFLIVEVQKQIERTRRFVMQPMQGLAGAIEARDGYIDNLNNTIQGKCFDLAARGGAGNGALGQLQAIYLVTVNLERIGDFCHKAARQLMHVADTSVLDEVELDTYLERVAQGVGRIERALFSRNADLALEICRIDAKLDQRYVDDFAALIERLDAAPSRADIVAAILTIRYFERMGDSLLNIGEAILSACLGQRIKLHQFVALESALERANLPADVQQLTLARVGETRSGSRIDQVSVAKETAGDKVIFKEGESRKLAEEMEGLERWNALMPGIAPRVISHIERDDSVALLTEYLEGFTIEQLLLQESTSTLDQALGRLTETLSEVWHRTRREEPARARFCDQIASRLPEVFSVNRGLRREDIIIGGRRIPSFEGLVEHCRTIEAELAAPFSVLIHGDLNVDNIIFDPAEARIRFIDLHRTERLDYLQDVSVFLISNFRLQVFEPERRKRIRTTIFEFLEFAADFARGAGDASFEARLTLGIARSLATSTRFVADHQFAKSMFLRARYLLERLAELRSSVDGGFVFPREVLVD